MYTHYIVVCSYTHFVEIGTVPHKFDQFVYICLINRPHVTQERWSFYLFRNT